MNDKIKALMPKPLPLDRYGYSEDDDVAKYCAEHGNAIIREVHAILDKHSIGIVPSEEDLKGLTEKVLFFKLNVTYENMDKVEETAIHIAKAIRSLMLGETK